MCRRLQVSVKTNIFQKWHALFKMVPSRTSMWLEAQDSAAKHSTTRLGLTSDLTCGDASTAKAEKPTVSVWSWWVIRALPLTAHVWSSHDLWGLWNAQGLYIEGCWLLGADRMDWPPPPRALVSITSFKAFGLLQEKTKVHRGVISQRSTIQGILRTKIPNCVSAAFMKTGQEETFENHWLPPCWIPISQVSGSAPVGCVQEAATWWFLLIDVSISLTNQKYIWKTKQKNMPISD